tara:strand:+ start:296 stop:514 length:219 start_codon:yes stop_codon:yes gene_type:complete
MPFHVKSVGAMGTGTVYYEGGNRWTQVYADRKQYSSKSDADALAATSITRTMGGRSYSYQPDVFKNSTVVTE